MPERGPAGQRSSLATLALLTVLAAAAIVWSISTAPSVPDYGSLPPTSSSAAAVLARAVDATLSDHSFTAEVVGVKGWFGEAGYHYSVEYRAPDSLETYPTHLRLAVTGTGATFIETSGGSGVWSETCPNPFKSGEQLASQFLDLLSGPVSVQGSGDRFTTEAIGGTVLNVTEQSQVDITTTISNGQVSSEDITTTVAPRSELRITYSGYDSSPPFALPASVTKGDSCRPTGT